MSRKRGRQDNYYLAMIDILFAMVLAYSTLFIISFVLIQPTAKQVDSNIKVKAEFVLSLAWPDNAMDDIDLWLQLPDGQKVMYGSPDKGVAVLDRDDLGGDKDVIPECPTCTTMKWIKLNRELITIRGISPGRYVAAVHVFAAKDVVGGFASEQKLPYKARVELTKLNPVASVVAVAEPELKTRGHVVAVFAFTIDEKGDVINVENDPPDVVVSQAQDGRP